MKAPVDRGKAELRMPGYVIDSSVYSQKEFREFLSASKENFGVIPDWTAREALASPQQRAVFESAAIMADYTDQIIVLHGAFEIAGMKLRAKDARDQIVDRKKTSGVKEYCADAKAGFDGNLKILIELVRQGFMAKRNIARMDGNGWPEAIAEFAGKFNAQDLRSIRVGQPNERVLSLVADQLVDIATNVMKKHPAGFEVPPKEHFFYSFTFRLNAYMVVYSMGRIKIGGEGNVPKCKLPNIMRDGAIATCATYFDGLLTKDDEQLRTYEYVSHLLNALLARLGPAA